MAESDDAGTAHVVEHKVGVTVTLGADPERTVVIPIEATNEGGASSGDYSGVPESVTFNSGETSKTFTITAAHDTADDDGESMKLSFGTLPGGVTAGTPNEATVAITDDDPSVTVSFGESSYTVAEGGSESVTVELSADPERTVVIPVSKTNQGATTTADYTGVPESVTFDAGETLTSFLFTAETDTADDQGESVRLSFTTMPEARVSEGTPSEAMVTIRQDSTQSILDCNSAIWFADLEFKSQSLPGEMWVLDDRPLDSEFDYNGVTYRFGGLSVDPYGHNIPINDRPNPPFAIPERTMFNLRLLNMSASGYSLDRFRMPNDDWMNWTLHVSTAKDGETLTAALPLSEGRFSEHYWIWHGSDLEALRLAWTEGQVYKLVIVEDPRSNRTPQVLGPPLYLKVGEYNNHELYVWWKMPENRVDRAPPNTTYKVQWKEATGSWDNPADVSEELDSPSPAQKETLVHVIRGLTGGVEYDVRVIANNPVGDSVPSEVVSATPTPLAESANQVVENTPAEGAPGIEGTPEMGQMLLAVTTDITGADGLNNVVFSYQWLADDVEISGGVGETYTLADMEEGKEIKVRVNFTDDAGNEESITSAATAAAELESATVDGATLTLTYNESLETGVTLPTSAFVVNVNGSSRTIMGAGVGQSSVLLLVSPGVVAGDTVTVDYTKPSGTNVIKDTDSRANRPNDTATLSFTITVNPQDCPAGARCGTTVTPTPIVITASDVRVTMKYTKPVSGDTQKRTLNQSTLTDPGKRWQIPEVREVTVMIEPTGNDLIPSNYEFAMILDTDNTGLQFNSDYACDTPVRPRVGSGAFNSRNKKVVSNGDTVLIIRCARGNPTNEAIDVQMRNTALTDSTITLDLTDNMLNVPFHHHREFTYKVDKRDIRRDGAPNGSPLLNSAVWERGAGVWHGITEEDSDGNSNKSS